MVRLVLSALCVCLFVTFPAWAQSPCCADPCTETCCETTYRTVVSYRPVTTISTSNMPTLVDVVARLLRALHDL